MAGEFRFEGRSLLWQLGLILIRRTKERIGSCCSNRRFPPRRIRWKRASTWGVTKGNNLRPYRNHKIYLTYLRLRDGLSFPFRMKLQFPSNCSEFVHLPFLLPTKRIWFLCSKRINIELYFHRKLLSCGVYRVYYDRIRQIYFVRRFSIFLLAGIIARVNICICTEYNDSSILENFIEIRVDFLSRSNLMIKRRVYLYIERNSDYERMEREQFNQFVLKKKKHFQMVKSRHDLPMDSYVPSRSAF